MCVRPQHARCTWGEPRPPGQRTLGGAIPGLRLHALKHARCASVAAIIALHVHGVAAALLPGGCAGSAAASPTTGGHLGLPPLLQCLGLVGSKQEEENEATLNEFATLAEATEKVFYDYSIVIITWCQCSVQKTHGRSSAHPSAVQAQRRVPAHAPQWRRALHFTMPTRAPRIAICPRPQTASPTPISLTLSHTLPFSPPPPCAPCTPPGCRRCKLWQPSMTMC